MRMGLHWPKLTTPINKYNMSSEAIGNLYWHPSYSDAPGLKVLTNWGQEGKSWGQVYNFFCMSYPGSNLT